MGKAKMAEQITFRDLPFICDDGMPRGILVVFDDNGGFELYSVPLDPPPDDPSGKQEQGDSI